ncbi:MAG: ribosome-recycling factor, partial [Oscillospiraceae bacterium]
IGINPTNDGRVLRVMFPQLTEERRKEIAKQIKKMGEDGKVAVRSIRRDANEKFKALKKTSEITEDDLKQLEDEMQKVTDRRCKEIDDIMKAKETEIMEI